MPWTKLVRASGLVERVCPHRIGHPDPASVELMRQATGDQTWDVHGCDGCCWSDLEANQEFRDGMKRARDDFESGQVAPFRHKVSRREALRQLSNEADEMGDYTE